MKSKIIYEIEDERKRQDQLWGGPDHDDSHSLYEWENFIQYQLDGYARAIGNKHVDAARERLIRIAALAVAATERIDRA